MPEKLTRSQREALITQVELFKAESIFYRKQIQHIRAMGMARKLKGWIEAYKRKICGAECAILWGRKELGMKDKEKLNPV